MLRSLLVGLDGTPHCQPAAELAIRWGQRFDSLIVGIGVVDEPSIRGANPNGTISHSYRAAYNQLLSEARRDVEQTLERFAIQCSGHQVSSKLLETEGKPCEKILTELQRYDLLLLGCETHFRYRSETSCCKTLENVLRNALRPVVVVPESLPPDEHRAVIVAYDGSVQSARALQAFVASGLSHLGPIYVVSVTADSSVKSAQVADHAIEFLRFHELPAHRIPLIGGDTPSQQFLEYAAEQQAGLIVMGAYGQNRISEFWVGSTTRTALRDSTVPLLLYH